MTEITYLERPKEKDVFHSVTGIVDYLSNSANSPFVSTSDPRKKLLETAKTRDQQQVSYDHVETRDECPKRVKFHPECILGADSGEDLAFDPTKVYNANDDEQRDKAILTDAKSANSSQPNSSLTANQVYTARGMKNNQKQTGTHTSTESKKQSLLKELKANVTSDDSQSSSKVASRSKNKSQVEQVAKVLEVETEGLTSGGTKSLMSPKKFSVSRINKARTGPVPKSDDFFSELKQWHKEYALREVEKPQEISIITTQEFTASSTGNENMQDGNDHASTIKEAKKMKQEKKAEMKREIKKAAADAKDVLANQKKTKKQMKKEAKRIEKRNKKAKSNAPVNKSTNDDGSTNKKSTGLPEKKEKKKFWKLSTKSKRKQKREGSVSSNSTGDSSKSQVAPLNYGTLGFTENPKKVAIKDPKESFNDTLDKFLKLQLEMHEDEGSVEPNAKKSLEAGVLVETVNSTEEKEQKQIAEAPDVAVEEAQKEGTKDGAEEFLEKATPSQESKEKPKESEAWKKKIGGLFQKEDKATPPVSVVKVDKFDIDKYESVAESEPKMDCAEIQAGLANMVDCTKPAVQVDTEEESPEEGNNTKAVPDTELEEPVPDVKIAENDREKPKSKLVPNFVVNHQTGEIVKSVDTTATEEVEQEETIATIENKVENFLQSHCPCMASKQQALSTELVNNTKEEENKTETALESQEKELSWFEMATGFFAITATPKSEESNKAAEKNTEDNEENPIETPPTPETTPLQTPKASNNKERAFFSTESDPPTETEQAADSSAVAEPEPTQSGTFDESRSSHQHEATRSSTFDDSLISNQEDTIEDSLLSKGVAKSGSFDDSLITLEEGTKVTKIEPAEPTDRPRQESLLDLAASNSEESVSLTADEDRPQKKMHQDETTESRSCADSQPRDSAAESHLCVDSTNQSNKPDPPSTIVDDQSRSLTASVKHSYTVDLGSRVDSEGKSKASKSSGNEKKKKKRISKPTDIVFFKKNKKKVPKTDDEDATVRAVIASKFSSGSTIFDFLPEDSENHGYRGNRRSAMSSAALPPLVRKAHVETADRVEKEPRKWVVNKQPSKKKVDRGGATLFGKLEPQSDEKKKKKKAKRTQTLF